MEANKAECSRGGAANKAMLQEKKKKKKVEEWNNTKERDGAGGCGAITHCCVLSNEINPFIRSSQAATEQLSLQWQPGSFSFLLPFPLMQFQSSKQTRRVLSSGGSIPWKMTSAACQQPVGAHFSIAGQSLTLDLCQGSKQTTLLPVRPVAPKLVCSVGKHIAVM